MPAPDFNAATVRLLAEQSLMICNQPLCSTATVGPSQVDVALKLKIGEAAHIRGARKDSARYDDDMTDAQRAAPENGIYLCANCHTMVDKNKGADFSADELREWRSTHAAFVRSLLLSHRSPLSTLRRLTEEGQLAQDACDALGGHGALYVDMGYEMPAHVVLSLDTLRRDLGRFMRGIRYDGELKGLLRRLRSVLQTYMNATSKYPESWTYELPRLRRDVGIVAKALRDDYGCVLHPGLTQILPN